MKALYLFFVVVAVVLYAQHTHGQNYTLLSGSLSSGGGKLTSSEYSTNVMLGQPIVGNPSSAEYQTGFGFWAQYDGLTSSFPVQFSVDGGWNMASVPLLRSDTRTNIFPTAVSNAFSYNNGYNAQTVLENGVGYWLKFPSGQLIQMLGTGVMADTIDVNVRWNMIGSLSYKISTDGVTPVPPVTITSSFYGYSGANGYEAEEILQPAKAYWVKVSQTGKLVLKSGSVLAVPSQIAAQVNSKKTENYQFASVIQDMPLNTLRIKDLNGRDGTLFFSSIPTDIDLSMFELPPPPPMGIFDVRFKSQRAIEIAEKEKGDSHEYPLQLNSVEFPIILEWNILEDNSKIELLINGQKSEKYGLNGSGSLKITDPKIIEMRLRMSSGAMSELPKVYALHQNYPNPFNPVTTIKYDLPNDSWVTLKIYNALGQEVVTLVDEMQEAGYKSVEWNTVSGNRVLSSSVYYYRLVAGEFTSMKKLLLVK